MNWKKEEMNRGGTGIKLKKVIRDHIEKSMREKETDEGRVYEGRGDKGMKRNKVREKVRRWR